MSMTGEEIKELFEDIVDDDELGETSFYILLNVAENQFEDERDWMVLRKTDRSLTHLSTDTYLTEHSLQTRFKRERKVKVQYASGETRELHPISLENIEVERNSIGYYAINYGTNKIQLTGQYSEDVTIIINYIERSEDIDGDAVVVWPGKYGAVLAYEMAQAYAGGIDGDEVNFKMSTKQLSEYQRIKSAMIRWDAGLQLKEIDGQSGINARAK